MAITSADFSKIWASTSPLTPYSFSESNYKEGWNFVGGTPPSRQMWDFLQKQNDEKSKYLFDNFDNYLPLAGGTLTGVVNGVTPTAGDDTTKLATTAYVQEEIRQHGNLPVGHEYFSMNPNVPQGSLPLLGGVYSRDTYSDLWEWVQTQSGYLKTEAEWQTLSTANNGNVPFYSSGDGSTTFRVPSPHCWVKGSNGSAQLVGSYLQAGLPNIEGSMKPSFLRSNESPTPTINGAFIGTTPGTAASWGNNVIASFNDITFDASKSNSIYGNANTVQPESVVGMWLVKAYGVIVDTGTIDEQAYIDDRFNASKQYTQDYFSGQMLYKGNILLATTLVNSAVTLNVNCSGYKFVILRLEGNDENMQDFLIPVGSDFYFAHRIFGADNGAATVNTKGHFDTVNGQLVIREVLVNGWTEVYVTVIGAI